jgi:hypothetical protein
VKENLKPYVYKQLESVKAQQRTFCRTVRRVIVCGKVKYYKVRSRRETESEKGVKSYVIDPKPGDLSMDRLKRE